MKVERREQFVHVLSPIEASPNLGQAFAELQVPLWAMGRGVTTRNQEQRDLRHERERIAPQRRDELH